MIMRNIEGLVISFEAPKRGRCGTEFDEDEVARKIYFSNYLDGYREAAHANKATNRLIDKIKRSLIGFALNLNVVARD